MNYQLELAGWVGRLVDLTIEDQAGLDPIAPPKMFLLHSVQSQENDRVLAFYLSDNQYVSVPLFDEPHTLLSGNKFESHDVQAKLIYKVVLI